MKMWIHAWAVQRGSSIAGETLSGSHWNVCGTRSTRFERLVPSYVSSTVLKISQTLSYLSLEKTYNEINTILYTFHRWGNFRPENKVTLSRSHNQKVTKERNLVERRKNPQGNWKRPTAYPQNGLRLEKGAGPRREGHMGEGDRKACISTWNEGWDCHMACRMEPGSTLGLEAWPWLNRMPSPSLRYNIFSYEIG